MKKIAIVLLLFLPAVLIAAEPEEKICSPFHQKLEKIEHLELTVSPAKFEFDGKAYEGCEIVFKSKWSLMKEGSSPMNETYPEEGGALYNAGWRVDENFSADGPSSSYYILRNGWKVCIVEWSYEAYFDEKTGDYVTGDDIVCNVKCGTERDLRGK
ncbi:MAG: hypothetical protein JW984_09050 [Deltaproteobacteria bacterium]|uniref:Uncharacterized protein n=1 Tax=Candidatus Zymogenus saltonus TaxID=2844893 RepID=A0A9D8KFP9_9DELT|nr:hypothetical protein [Candidatus Zymogenus saltonus]